MRWRYIYGTVTDDVYNTTKLIANGTNTAMVCYDTMENFWFWGVNRYSQFDGLTAIIMGFFQNLLGNVVTLTNIYKSITAAVTSNDYAQIWFQAGRIFKMLMDF